MKIGLFIPCYVDQFYPQIGMATVTILRDLLGHEVDFPTAQTCCGQPMANTGCVEDTRPLAERFVEIFADYECIVSPSGSCVSMVKNHYEGYFHNRSAYNKVKSNIFELCEFVFDQQSIESFPNAFPYRVGLHSSCHGLRELRLGSCSEKMTPLQGKVRGLLERVPDLELVDLERTDECCGFGGTFAVAEEGVSVAMGKDRVQDHVRSGAQVMTATDASCLMHLQGIISRQKQPIVSMHVAEILAGHQPSL